MKRFFLLSQLLLMGILSYSQKIQYSDFEKGDFENYRFEVIGKMHNHILVYSNNLRNRARLYANGSQLYIYDPHMKLEQKVTLPLPEVIDGVHFLVYENYFYLFYQYSYKRTVYCMAAKINEEGKMMEDPIQMDKTPDVSDLNRNTQIYTVINSEDKKHIIAFTVKGFMESGFTLTSISFNELLQPVKRFKGPIQAVSSLSNFSDYFVDNAGNLLFIGRPGGSWKNGDNLPLFLFKLRTVDNTLSNQVIDTTGVYSDQVRLFIDNTHHRYLIASIYSSRWGGNMKGVNMVLINSSNDSVISRSYTPVNNSLSAQINKNPKLALNNFYIQQIILKKDGGFLVIAEELFNNNIPYEYRWNRLDEQAPVVAVDYVFYDPYRLNHFFPWDEWSSTMQYMYESNKTLFICFHPDGKAEWQNLLDTRQEEMFLGFLGFKEIVESDFIYLLFNESIEEKSFLSVKSINGSGDLNTGTRLNVNTELKNINRSYNYFPRFSKQISENEVLIPCGNRTETGFLKLEY